MNDKTVIFFAVAIIILVYAIGKSKTGLGGYFSRRLPQHHNATLVSVLLHLPDDKINDLLSLYKAEFGTGPARYARQTLKKWRSGRVQPATQTYQRFLVHLPKVMSYDMKCEVLRHFMQELSKKTTYRLDVTTDDWEAKISPLIETMIATAYTAQLPAEVERKLNWLGDGDMQAAQNILRASQVEESKIMVASLHEEFQNLEHLLANDNLKPRITHVLRFPYGTIELNVKRGDSS